MGLGAIELFILLIVLSGITIKFRGKCSPNEAHTEPRCESRGSGAMWFFVPLLLFVCVATPFLWYKLLARSHVADEQFAATQREVMAVRLEAQRRLEAGLQEAEVRPGADWHLDSLRLADATKDAPAPTALPEWVPHPKSGQVGGERFSASSTQYATVEEATQDARIKLSTAIASELRDSHMPGTGTIPSPILDHSVIRERHVEAIDREAKGFSFRVYRVHLLGEVTPQTNQVLHQVWKSSVVEERIAGIGIGTGLLVLLVGIAAIYLRIDPATRKRRRVLLPIGAMLVLLGGTGGILAAVRSMPVRDYGQATPVFPTTYSQHPDSVAAVPERQDQYNP